MQKTWLVIVSVSIAACGGNAQLRTEVDRLRAEVRELGTRQTKTEQQLQEVTMRNPVHPSTVVDERESSVATLSDEEIVKKVQAISVEVCACKDLPCTERAMKKMDKLKEQDKPGDQAMKEIGESFREMVECMTALTPKEKTP